jgi:uncharacterized protein
MPVHALGGVLMLKNLPPMIIDVHSHTWNFSSDFSDDFIQQAGRARPGVKVDISATYEAYRASAPENTRTIVFGGRKKCQA